MPIFKTEKDFLQFEKVLVEAKKLVDVDIDAFCIMPNHFHFALRPKRDGDLQKFMGWLTKTQDKWVLTPLPPLVASHLNPTP